MEKCAIKCQRLHLLIGSLTHSDPAPLFAGFAFQAVFTVITLRASGANKSRAAPPPFAAGSTLVFVKAVTVASIRAEPYGLASLGLHLFCLRVKSSIMILCSL